jgi:type IV secretory pathway ATPase VirB11/archaellum biosynthesis ATPase/thymidylate synthase ThyX
MIRDLFKKSKKLIELKKEEKTLFKIDTEQQIPTLTLPEKKEQVDVKYPLIAPYAYAHIYWDATAKELIYKVEEPELTPREKRILTLLEEGIKELINVSFLKVQEGTKLIEFLEKNIRVLLTELGLKLPQDSYLKIMYYIYRDFVGLNEIEPLLCDYFIEDIECNGIKSPIYIVHRVYRNIKTNIIYDSIPKLASFVEKLAQKCGRYISYASPLLDGTLPDGSLDYNEPFIYKENGIVKISKIGRIIDKFYNNKESNFPIKIKNITVPAFDPKTLKISWKKIDYVYRHKIHEPLYKLKLEFGRKITLTGAHSIFKLTKEGVKAEKTSDIREDDYLAIPLTIPENDILKEFNLAKELATSKYYKKLVIEDVPFNIFINKKSVIKKYLNKNYKHPYQAYYELRKKRILPIKLWYLLPEKILRKCKIKATSPVKIPTFLKVNKELLRLLGYYIAEGWTTNIRNWKKIQFCLNKKEKDYIKDIRNCFKKCFYINPYIESVYKNAVKITINSLLCWLVFNDILKVTRYAKEKRVPEIVFNVNKELQKEFIKGWHNGDFGSTSSLNLAIDISYLSLFNNNIVPFYDRNRVSEIDNQLVKSHEHYTNSFRRNLNNSYCSMIPLEIFNPLNETHLSFKNKRLSRKRLQRIIDHIRFKRFENINGVISEKFLKEWEKRGFLNKNKLTKKGADVVKELKIIKNLINSDLGFLKVKKIEKVNSSSDFVYDVSIKGYENFVGGTGGVCCHNSRVNATYTTDISSRGPTFTLRKFTKTPWSPIKLIELGTLSPEILAYLWLLIEYESNIMVIGGTGSGKTSLLNALAFFIPPQARVVSIEDTKELMLERENWLPSVARAGIGLANIIGQKYGEVSLFDLLKESFRQRPDYVIVGEIRGRESYVLFQGMASGHPSFGTMHAEDILTMVRRLETPPINLSPSLVESMDVVCVMSHVKVKGKPARRLTNISEIIKIHEKLGESEINTPFVWDPRTDSFFFKTESIVFNKIMKQSGLTRQQLITEFDRRTRLLMRLYQNKIFNYKQVQSIINEYYVSPQTVLKKYGVI